MGQLCPVCKKLIPDLELDLHFIDAHLNGD